jgi:FKBP-type peptidyl-prolyl cis-trans isomerase 2
LFTHESKVATQELEQRLLLSERRHVSTERGTSMVTTHRLAGDTVRRESEVRDLRAAENKTLRKAVRNGRVEQGHKSTLELCPHYSFGGWGQRHQKQQ